MFPFAHRPGVISATLPPAAEAANRFTTPDDRPDVHFTQTLTVRSPPEQLLRNCSRCQSPDVHPCVVASVQHCCAAACCASAALNHPAISTVTPNTLAFITLLRMIRTCVEEKWSGPWTPTICSLC